MINDLGLLWSLIVFFVTGCGFAWDAIRLLVLKWPTISEQIWVGMANWRANQGWSNECWWGIIIVAFLESGGAGLALHFLWPERVGK